MNRVALQIQMQVSGGRDRHGRFSVLVHVVNGSMGWSDCDLATARHLIQTEDVHGVTLAQLDAQIRGILNQARAAITTAEGEVLHLESDEEFEVEIQALLSDPVRLNRTLDGIAFSMR